VTPETPVDTSYELGDERSHWNGPERPFNELRCASGSPVGASSATVHYKRRQGEATGECPLRRVSSLVRLRRRVLAGLGAVSAVVRGVLPSGSPWASASTGTGPNLITNGCLHVPGHSTGYETLKSGSTQVPHGPWAVTTA
jgi:hypothetical protein